MDAAESLELGVLWQRWHGARAADARAALVKHYLRFARIMAGKLFARCGGSDVCFDDYLQYARVGLLESLDRFDPNRGVKFETFAALRISGAILNGVDSASEVREQLSARRRVLAGRVESVRGAAPDPDDAQAVFASLASLAIGLAVGFALEDTGMYQDQESGGADCAYAGIELRQLQRTLRTLVDDLAGNEHRVIHAHYLQGLTFERIAAMLALSTGRVAQLHHAALRTLRARLTHHGGFRLDV